jgi:hypothetical protein
MVQSISEDEYRALGSGRKPKRKRRGPKTTYQPMPKCERCRKGGPGAYASTPDDRQLHFPRCSDRDYWETFDWQPPTAIAPRYWRPKRWRET